MAIELIWGPPPPTGKYADYIIEVVALLKEKPEEWAELPFIDNQGFSINMGPAMKRHDPHIEYTQRPIPGQAKKYRVWACWHTEIPAPKGPGRKPAKPKEEAPSEPQDDDAKGKPRKGW